MKYIHAHKMSEQGNTENIEISKRAELGHLSKRDQKLHAWQDGLVQRWISSAVRGHTSPTTWLRLQSLAFDARYLQLPVTEAPSHTNASQQIFQDLVVIKFVK